MITPQASQLPPRVIRILLSRGNQLPPLRWTTPVDSAASASLGDDSGGAAILEGKELVDERMGHAVRSLLCLWAGMIDEAEKASAHAPPTEAQYIRGLCARHRGDAEAAKTYFQKVGDHGVFKKLGAFVPTRLNGALAEALERFRQIVQQVGQVWEPFAFTDLLEQAARGGLSTEGMSLVRVLQSAEFEHLLVHCVNAAIGESTTSSGESEKGKTSVQRNRTATKSNDSGKSNAGGRDAALRRPVPRAKSTVVVCCPKCNTSRVFPDASRGQMQPCQTCGTHFQIPVKKTMKERSSL